jgi:hypothetical protein
MHSRIFISLSCEGFAGLPSLLRLPQDTRLPLQAAAESIFHSHRHAFRLAMVQPGVKRRPMLQHVIKHRIRTIKDFFPQAPVKPAQGKQLQ